MNNNFNLIKAFIHHWRAGVPLPLPALLSLLGAVPAKPSSGAPDARAKRRAAEQRCVAMKLLAAGEIYSLLLAHCSLLTVHGSSLTSHFSLLATHSLLEQPEPLGSSNMSPVLRARTPKPSKRTFVPSDNKKEARLHDPNILARQDFATQVWCTGKLSL